MCKALGKVHTWKEAQKYFPLESTFKIETKTCSPLILLYSLYTWKFNIGQSIKVCLLSLAWRSYCVWKTYKEELLINNNVFFISHILPQKNKPWASRVHATHLIGCLNILFLKLIVTGLCLDLINGKWNILIPFNIFS